MRVLVVEDEEHLAAAVADGLTAEGFEVDVVHDGLDGLWRAREGSYDAIVLDILLPGMHGYKVCRTCATRACGRRSSCSPPRTASTTRPRRSTPAPTTSCRSRSRSSCCSPGCARYPARRATAPDGAHGRHARARPRHAPRAPRGGTDIRLTAREFALLEFLMRKDGNVASKAEILDQVWGIDFEVTRTSSRSTSGTCARRSTSRSASRRIETVRGAGYRLVARAERRAVTEPPRRRHWWPRPSGAAHARRDVAFAVALRAAAFGLVRVVHDNLVDRIQETNQQQLAELAARRCDSGACNRSTTASPSTRVYRYAGGCRPRTADPHRRSDGERTQRRDPDGGRQHHAGRAARSTRSTDRRHVNDVLLVAVPAARRSWSPSRPGTSPDVRSARSRPSGSQAESITRHHDPPSRARTRHRRRGRPPGAHDERDARPARDVVAAPAAVRLRRVARAAQPARLDPHEPRGRAAQRGPRRLARGARRVLAEDERMEDTVSELLDLARLDEPPGHAPLDIAARGRPRRAGARRDACATTACSSTRRGCPPAVSTAAASSCARVVRNLLDNAARHAQTTVAIELSQRQRAGIVVLTVDDDGPGSRTRIASGCSSGSPASTTGAPATRAGSGSACRW